MEPLVFALHGLLGASLSVLVKAYSWRYLKTWKAIRAYMLGACAGYIYWLFHSEYSFPNAVMTVVVGYFAEDFIRSLFERLGTLGKRKE